MFQNKKVIQLIVSAVMALLFINFYLKSKEKSIQDAYGMTDILVASRDVPAHQLLTPAYLTTSKVPLRYVEPGALMVKIPSETLKRVQGKVTIAPVPAGAQIMISNLVDPSTKDTGIAPVIPPGKRGYLLRLGNTDVADLILPGDHIDVLATFTMKQQSAASGSSKATYTILQNILVVSVGKVIKHNTEDVTTKKEGAEGLNITLALAPDEAERMALAQSESQGEISVIVRPHGENDIKTLPGVTPGRLLG